MSTEVVKDLMSSPRYHVYSIEGYEWRRVDPPIVIGGERRSRYLIPVIKEYVDLNTGEIVLAGDLHARRDPHLPASMHFSERALQRAFILNKLRPKVRSFAKFVLRFKNKRRGITPGIDKLVEWYAKLVGKRASDVRRYVARLEEVDLLAGSNLLGPLFQDAGKKEKAVIHLGEEFSAHIVFSAMLLSRESPLEEFEEAEQKAA